MEDLAQQDGKEQIQRQFAQLQAEMKRVMAEPAAPPPDAAQVADAPPADSPPADGPVDIQRIEQGLDALRRDTELLHARMVPPAGRVVSADTVAVLREWTDDGADKLTRAVQRNREAIDDLALRLDDLSRRRPSRWTAPLAILLGALAIAAAVLLSVPGRAERLIDLFDTMVFPPKPHAETLPATAPEPIEPARKAETAAAPPQPPAAPPASAVASPAVPAPQIADPPAPTQQGAEAPAPAAIVPAPPAPAEAAQAEPSTKPAPPASESSTPAAAAAIQPPAAHGRIVLRATGDTWVEVRNRQGGALIARLLREGDTWTVPDQPGLLLSTGNAGGLDVLVDGTPAPALGSAGTVRRDVPLDPALVRAGRYASDPTARPKPSAAAR